MKSAFAVVGLFLLALLTSTTIARKDPGEYWHVVMRDQPMPEAIQGLLNGGTTILSFSNKKKDCHMSSEGNVIKGTQKKGFAQEFKPIPNISVYHNDAKLKEEKSFDKDFEPRPNISAYSDDIGVKGEKKGFEARPNISAYSDDIGVKGEKSFTKDFEPRPNISAYKD